MHHRFKRHWWQICHQVNNTGGKLTTGPVVTPFQRFSLTTGVFVIGFKFSTGINDDGSSKFTNGVNAECHTTA
jgi:hypothetical protein